MLIFEARFSSSFCSGVGVTSGVGGGVSVGVGVASDVGYGVIVGISIVAVDPSGNVAVNSGLGGVGIVKVASGLVVGIVSGLLDSQA